MMLLFTGCANNQQEAIENICKGVKNTSKTCRSAVGIAAKCGECTQTKENADFENGTKMDISTNELLENSMLW
jgi:fructose-1,6-bisphosphatase